MDKANKTVFIASKYGEEAVLRPLLSEFGLDCVPIEAAGDPTGVASLRDLLRIKIEAAAKLQPDARLILASEGHFSTQPIFGSLKLNLETLLLKDRLRDTEIYAEFLCTSPVHGEKTIGPSEDFKAFLKSVQFPKHAVTVRPEGHASPTHTGLQCDRELAQAMLECFQISETGKITIATDLRASHNPTRQTAIHNAAKALCAQLRSIQNF